jgi:hypothetical protein
MRLLALTIALVSLASSAGAQPRPSTLSLTCEQARALVNARGAVVLSTGATTYTRFVISSAFCERSETTEPVWARTADAAQCLVGSRCRDEDIEIGD